MNSVFITGIPTSGKSYLADKVAASLGLVHVKMDDLWDTLAKDPVLEPWLNYFWHKDEAEYYHTTTRDEQWRDIVNQSEAFWETAKKHMEKIVAKGQPAIFEGVNLLPHLMCNCSLKGVVLLASSKSQVFERLKANPRWSDKVDLQQIEAAAFFEGENAHYATEAGRYGYPAFSDPSAAEAELIKLIQQP